MKIIQSMLDTDLYKLTMQNGVQRLYPDATGIVRFINRKPQTQKFTPQSVEEIKDAIYHMSELRLSNDEHDWLRERNPYLGPGYLSLLKNYQFDPREVHIELGENGNLIIYVEGLWHRIILWEVPLMAIISEVYFNTIHTEWSMDGQDERARQKQQMMADAGCVNADMGTRRRRSFLSQANVVEQMKKFKDSFVGTSNVHLAMLHDVKAIGTMAHEWIQAHSVLCGLRHANRYALNAWNQVYQGHLGIALPDTYGTPSFWRDFDRTLSRTFDGVRHDSGNPFHFVDAAVKHYRHHAIDPMTKTSVFSDGLNVQKAIEIHEYCENRIRDSYGIGTHYTNDFDDGLALKMVIKLIQLNGVPVVKLSDEPGKVSGDKDAVRVANYVHRGIPLDNYGIPLDNYGEDESGQLAVLESRRIER